MKTYDHIILEAKKGDHKSLKHTMIFTLIAL